MDLDKSPRELLGEALVAKLFHVYVKELAPWYDLCDHARVFERKVAQTALDSALLFATIIAFAAIYMNRKEAFPRAVAEIYHDRCLKLLVALSPQNEDIQNGTALASTCLLRSYEILSEDEDPGRHLFGASTLVPLVPPFDDHSLQAAGFWNFLRQDISHSLVHECPLKIQVGEAIGQPLNDNDVANMVTLLLGKAINGAFGGNEDDVTSQLERWERFIKRPFSRIDETPFPAIRMTQDCDVLAMQYLQVARCLLRPEGREKAAAEICGLAISSESWSVVVNSYGSICFAAQYLTSTEAQQTLVDFLRNSGRKTGWSVASLLSKLKQRWEEHAIAEGAPDRSYISQ